MEPLLALTAMGKGVVILALTGLAGPLAGVVLKRVGGGWSSFGQGPFSLLREEPARRGSGAPAPPVDPAIQAAEVRQMLAAKSDRRQRRGLAPLDVEAEATRLLERAERPSRGVQETMDEELRAEVRQLVIARNERRRRQGLSALDVEVETERQLVDLVGSD
jgi:hypothetical protein